MKSIQTVSAVLVVMAASLVPAFGQRQGGDRGEGNRNEGNRGGWYRGGGEQRMQQQPRQQQQQGFQQQQPQQRMMQAPPQQQNYRQQQQPPQVQMQQNYRQQQGYQQQPQERGFYRQERGNSGWQQGGGVQQFYRGQQNYRQEQQFRQQPQYRQSYGGGWQGRSWSDRGGYRGEYIPQDRFYRSFGRDHYFRIGRPAYYEGYPRFEYGGYSFRLVDPYPEYWGDDWYDSDDVYVDYEDGGYYLFNRRYPGQGISIEIGF